MNSQLTSSPPPIPHQNQHQSQMQIIQAPKQLQLEYIIDSLHLFTDNNKEPIYELQFFHSETIKQNQQNIVENQFIFENIVKNDVGVFYQQKIPTITLLGYMQRIQKFTNSQIEIFVVALIYINRFIQAQNYVSFNQYTAHRLIFMATIIAIKFLHDKEPGDTSYFAKIGGIKKSEFKKLEYLFLNFISYKLLIDPTEYRKMHQSILYQRDPCEQYMNF